MCFPFALHCAGHFVVDESNQDTYKSGVMLGTLNPGNLEPQNPGNPELWNLVTLEICNLATLETCNCGILEPCKALEPCLITLQPWNPGTCCWVAKLGWCNDILKHSSSTGISSLWTRWKWCGVVAKFAPPQFRRIGTFSYTYRISMALNWDTSRDFGSAPCVEHGWQQWDFDDHSTTEMFHPCQKSKLSPVFKLGRWKSWFMDVFPIRTFISRGGFPASHVWWLWRHLWGRSMGWQPMTLLSTQYRCWPAFQVAGTVWSGQPGNLL